MKNKKFLNLTKKILYPNPSEGLAEFIGIFLGDGGFGTRYQLAISFNHRCEKEYAKYIQKMVYSLFGIESRIRVRRKYGSAEVVISSSNLVEYVKDLIGVGEREGKYSFKLPSWLKKNDRYEMGFVRGLFDSEGCVYRHVYNSNGKKYSYTKIAITNYNDRILSALQEVLTSIGIASVKYRNRIHLYSASEVDKFFSVVGSNNPKNLTRYNSFDN